MRKVIINILLVCLTILGLTGCGKEYKCQSCGEVFHGTAYTNMEATSILCEKCATRYWNPFPIKDHKYLGD